MTTLSPPAPSGLRTTYAYFGGLTLLVYLASPNDYLVDITTSFMLKDQLHASAMQVSQFRLVTAAPIYLAVLFGFTRDLWNPLGLRDRGYFIVFGALTSLLFIALALLPLTYAGLYLGLLLIMTSARFVAAAYQGLLALVGQEQLLSGRLAALWQAVSFAPVLVGAFASGLLAEILRPSQTFLVLAAISAGTALFGLWRPRAVFGGAYDSPLASASSLWNDVKRLFRHKAIYPAVLMMFMFQFAPGANTPLEYYLTDQLHASDAAYGYFQAIFLASFIPVFLLYGWLCKRMAFGRLLFWGTVISIPQMVPLALIHSAAAALWMAVPMGAMGGIFGAAIYDLAIRSCPPGLQGALMMLVAAGNLLSTRGGDVVGSAIYRADPVHGFTWCVVTITLVYALMLPVIWLIPRHILATADGEPDPARDAEVAMELARDAA